MIAIKKLVSGIATAGVLVGTMVTPVFAESTLEISGNGVGSYNKISSHSTCVSGVKQVSNTTALTQVSAYSGTGENQASGNTGGTTTVDTGDATTTVAVVVTGGSNEADAPSCCDCANGGPVDETISGNGAFSVNKIYSSDTKVTFSKQKTNTTALTGISAAAKTGKNKAKWNTGSGTSVLTGAAETLVGVEVSGGSNTLNP